jgi:hypothetical protein
MRPERAARRLLATTRAKAKMYEFDVPAEEHIDLPQSPDQLFALAVGLLGDAAAAIADMSPDVERDPVTPDALTFAGIYFDAYLQSRLGDFAHLEFPILASACYYLADNPGSSKVVLNQAEAPPPQLGSGLALLTYRLLRSDYSEFPAAAYRTLSGELLAVLSAYLQGDGASAIAPDKPWVTYFAPGTAHAPHHAPKDWIAKFKGQFDQGWDKVREETLALQKRLGVVPQDTKLTERSAGIPAWDSLDADHKKVAAHMMEVYAAALSYCETQMGRIVDALADLGELDNTLVIYIQGDNGASAEGGPQGLLNEMAFFNAIPEDFKEVMRRMDELGGPTTFNHYPIGWAHAMSCALVDQPTISGRSCANSGHYKPLFACVDRTFVKSISALSRPAVARPSGCRSERGRVSFVHPPHVGRDERDGAGDAVVFLVGSFELWHENGIVRTITLNCCLL